MPPEGIRDMNQAIILTIEEWLGECGLSATDKEIEALEEGIQAAHDMTFYQTGWTPGHQGKSAERKEIERLEGTIRQLEGFLTQKGYNVWAYEGEVVHQYQNACGTMSYLSKDVYNF